MTNTADTLKAVERAVTDKSYAERAVTDKSYAPKDNYASKDNHTLSQLIDEMEQLHRELGDTIRRAKHVLALVVGGLK